MSAAPSTPLTRRRFVSGLAAVACPTVIIGEATTTAMAQAARVTRHARGARPPAGLENRVRELFKAGGAKIESLEPAPRQFDWRDTGFVTPVRSQGSCGSCWLFAALAAYESAYLIATRTADTGNLEVSEQQILDCSFAETNCVVGGWHEVVFAYLLTEGAIGAYDSNGVPKYLYDSNNPQRGSFCNSNFGNRAYYARDWGYVLADAIVPPVGVLKQAISSKGPIVCGVTAGNEWDDLVNHLDANGVIDASRSTLSASDINHEVLIVGWVDDLQGKDLQGNNFPPGVWIVKNSWGNTWGVNGYVKIPYGGDNIGYGASWVRAWG